MQDRNQYAIDILDVTLDVIEKLQSTGSEYIKPSKLASTLGINRTRAFRILKTLEHRGYVEVDPLTQGYRLGLKFIFIAKGILEGMNLRRESGPILKELAQATGDAVSLLVLSGQSAICIDHYPGEYLLQIATPVGQTIPLHIGASPKLLLAYLPEPEREQIIQSLTLTPYTENTITNRDQFREVLNDIVTKGYALDNQDYETGAYAVAAPVRDHSGQVIAGITVAKPEVRFSPEQRALLIRQVIEAACKLSHQLGYNPNFEPEYFRQNHQKSMDLMPQGMAEEDC